MAQQQVAFTERSEHALCWIDLRAALRNPDGIAQRVKAFQRLQLHEGRQIERTGGLHHILFGQLERLLQKLAHFSWCIGADL